MLGYECNIFYKDAKARMLSEFEIKRTDGTLSKVHDETHCFNVSNYSAITAKALMRAQDYTELENRAGMLTAVTGLLHDVRRYATETEPHGPAGEKYIRSIKEEHPWDKLDQEGFDIVCSVVKNHERPFGEITKEYGSPLGDEDKIMASVVAHSILTGDKFFEASGPRVLERRSYFVGKERMKKDITMFEYPDESDLAVLGETMIRLYKRNPIDTYPEWLKPFAQTWHGLQYQFYKGLLESRKMSEEEAADFMLEKEFPRFTQETCDLIKKEKHLSGKHFGEDYSILSESIKKLDELPEHDLNDLALSSALLVNEFSRADNPNNANLVDISPCEYPSNYIRFMGMISGYRNASDSFISDFEAKLEESIKICL